MAGSNVSLTYQGVTQDGGLLLNFKHSLGLQQQQQGAKQAESRSLKNLRKAQSHGRKCAPLS